MLQGGTLPARRKGDSDEYQSPPEVLDILIPYLKPEWILWEPAAGEGNLVRGLTKEGFIVTATDILTGTDFLTTDPWFPYDCIITNPPFSIKQEFLQRCYDLGKPFALLLPIMALDTQKRQSLYKQYGIELLVLPKQVFFIHSGTGKGARFVCAWFCWNLLGKELVFS